MLNTLLHIKIGRQQNALKIRTDTNSALFDSATSSMFHSWTHVIDDELRIGMTFGDREEFEQWFERAELYRDYWLLSAEYPMHGTLNPESDIIWLDVPNDIAQKMLNEPDADYMISDAGYAEDVNMRRIMTWFPSIDAFADWYASMIE